MPSWALGRPRLLEVLSEGDAPLLLVRAGAGYGKTLLASQWAQQQQSVLWCDLAQLERADEALATLESQAGPLVLDHYRPGDTALDCALAALLEGRPPGSQLLLLSRTQPRLEGVAERPATALASFLEDDLAFTPAEVAALFSRAGLSIDDEPLAAVMARSLGWPLAVHLALRHAKAGRAPTALSGAATPLAEYFESEVWKALPVAHQDFLLNTAVLAELRPAWCGALTKTTGAGRTLRALRAAGAPLVAPRHADDSYSCHPLFRDFLLAKLGEEPHRRRRQEQRAALTLAAENLPLEATAHALEAQDWELALHCLHRSADQAFREGKSALLRESMRLLPDRYRERPAWLRTEAYLAWAAGDHELALAKAAQAGTAADPDMCAEALILRAGVYGTRGDREAEMRALQAALAASPIGLQLRGKLYYLLGSAHQKAGALERAQAALRRALEHSHAGDPVHTAVMGALPLVHLARGKPRAAVQGLERALEANRRLGSKRGEAFTLYHLALALNQAGLHPRAFEVLREAEELASALNLAYLAALIKREQADTLRDLFAAESMQRYREAIAALEALGASAGLLHAHHGLAVAYRREGEIAAARRQAARALTHAAAGEAAFVALVRVHAALLEGATGAATRYLAAVSAYPQRYYQAQALLYAAALVTKTDGARAAQLGREALALVQDEGFEHLLKEESALLAALSPSTSEAAASATLAPPALSLRLLGRLELRDGGSVLKLRPQALQLLAYLALRRGSTTDVWQLLDALWPERGERMKATLQTLVWLLRRNLGKGVIANNATGYTFDPAGQVWVDVEAFRQHLRAGQLEEAIRLYRGELLPGVSWAECERPHLERQYLRALEELAGQHLSRGRVAEGVALLERIITLDPLAEAVYEKLVAYHQTAGNEGTVRRLRQAFHHHLEELMDP